MYLWNTRELAESLAKGKVSPKEKLLYLIVGQTLYILFSFAPLLASTPIDWIDIGEVISVLSITVIGLYFSYKSNGGESGSGLLEYFVCLTVPLFIKVIVFFWGLYAAFFWTTGFFVAKLPSDLDQVLYYTYKGVTFFVVVAATLFFYWRMSFHIKFIRMNRGS